MDIKRGKTVLVWIFQTVIPRGLALCAVVLTFFMLA